jgi:hypothetical protein
MDRFPNWKSGELLLEQEFQPSVTERQNHPVLLNPVLYHPHFSQAEKYWSGRLYSALGNLSIIDLNRIQGGPLPALEYRNTGFSRLYGRSGSLGFERENSKLIERESLGNNPVVRFPQRKRQANGKGKGKSLLRHFEV